MADVDVDDFLGARRRSAGIRPREAAIGRRLVLDRGRGPGRAESQISSFSFPFLHSDLLKFTVFREKQLKATMFARRAPASEMDRSCLLYTSPSPRD